MNKAIRHKGTKAFTMAEILISLTIIGVIAAITLPALRANINESTWRTQRKALYSRLSQAISMLPSLNGYGEYEGSWANNNVTVSKDTAAQAFVTDGLAKVLKINNICAHDNLKKCGILSKYKALNGSKKDFPQNLGQFNKYFISEAPGHAAYINPQKHINTNAVAFETANGEHVAVFYNPWCANRDMRFSIINGTDSGWVDAESIFPYMCATFLFDLNGIKGPNQMGKDMWVITSLYSVEPSVVMFEPDKILTKSKSNLTFDEAKQYCATQNARMANLDEGIAGYLSNIAFGWLGTETDINNRAYTIECGTLFKYKKSNKFNLRCIKR